MNKNNGFTLIEVIVGTTILAILVFSIYSTFEYSLRLAQDKSRREDALSIANEQLEYYRSIDYDTLGSPNTEIVCDPSPCTIAPTSYVERNGVNYTVIIDISYINDNFDNIPQTSEGIDSTGAGDYKKVSVEVRWPSSYSSPSIELVTTFAPIGIESDCGGGILKVSVFDANASSLSGASVYIKNDTTSILKDLETNDDGEITVNCLPEELNNTYEVTANAPDSVYYDSNYSTAQTCPIGTGTPNPICPTSSPSNATPTNPHVNIIEDNITSVSFSIDLLSTLNIKTVTQNLPGEWTINDTTGDGTNQDKPTVVAGTDGSYYFFWRDDRQGAGIERVYGQKYNSLKEAQWDDDAVEPGMQDIKVITGNDQELPNISIDSLGNAYIAWYHESGGNQETKIEKLNSADGNSVWNTTLDVDTTSQSKDQTKPQINVEDNDKFLYITYLDNSDDTNDIYVDRINTDHSISDVLYCNEDNAPCATESNPCGSSGTCTKWTGETKVNDDLSGNTQYLYQTIIESGTDDLYVVWHDNRNTNNDIFAQKINPTGSLDSTWNSNIKINETSTEDQSNPSIAITDEDGTNYLYIVWQDFRNSIDYNIYLAKYDTDGNRVSGFVDKNITTKDTTESDQTNPHIAIDSNNNIYVAWVDERNGNPDIYLQKFDTTGTSQWDDDMRINNDQSGNAIQDNPKVIINNLNEVVIVWQDNDSGDYDIRAATFTYGVPVFIGNVPLRIHGIKKIGKDIDSNNIYKFDINTSTDENGLSNNSNIEWDSYLIDVTGEDYTLLRTEPPLPHTIQPNSTNTITVFVEST